MGGNLFRPDPVPPPLREPIVSTDASGKITVDPTSGSQVTRTWGRHFRVLADTSEALSGRGYVIEGTHTTRLEIDPSVDVPAGTLYIETDRNAIYLAGYFWTYVAGLFTTTVANAPTDLGSYDAGFRCRLTDVDHDVQWDGQKWAFVGEQAGFSVPFAFPPSGTGWQLCNGSSTTYLQVGALLSLQPYTTPNTAGTYFRR